MSRDRVEFAHLLRGVAALSVVLFHYLGVFWAWPQIVGGLLHAPPVEPSASMVRVSSVFGPGHAFNAGHFGVSLFFLVSGFVIPFAFMRQERAGFLIARVLRLWPTYAVGLSATLIWLTVAGLAFSHVLPGDRGVIAWNYALGLRDLAGAPSLDGIVWTLEIEIRFYLVCLLVAPSLKEGRPAGVLTALVGVLAVTGVVDLAWGGRSSKGWSLIPYVIGLDGQMIAFLLIGTLFHLRLRQRLSWPVTAALVGLAFACFAWLWGRGPLAAEATAGVVSYGAALAVFASCFALRSRIHGSFALSWLADISYPLYVAHAMPGYAIVRLMLAAKAPPWVGIAAAAIWAFGGAVLLHRIVEVPTRNLGRRLASANGRPRPDWGAPRPRMREVPSGISAAHQRQESTTAPSRSSQAPG